MLKSGFPFFLARSEKMTMKIQGEKVKIQGETLIQSGECKLCICMHKYLSSCPKGQQAIPHLLEDDSPTLNCPQQ